MLPKWQHPNSVGLVETQQVTLSLPPQGLVLESGSRLSEVTVAYETYGRLNAARDNAVMICHALSGDAHVAGYHTPEDAKPGWWDDMVGPGKGLDTNRFFVICSNILGGCMGTTGPASIDPRDGKPYGSRFPDITIGDMVVVQRHLLTHFGIDRMAAVIGGSLGGMQVLEWSIRYPTVPQRAICIASATSLSAQALAFDVVGRHAILRDPCWAGGDYYATGKVPALGLSQARMLGHITYLSPEIMTSKFGRDKRADAAPVNRFQTPFQIESYLAYQGRKFTQRFDANAYLHITQAMDRYDLAERFESLEQAFAPVQTRFLVVALSSDWLFPPEQSREIAAALLRAGKSVSYCMLHAPYGHDAFLVDIEHLTETVRAFMGGDPAPDDGMPAGPDYQAIAATVPQGARVLDLGCGDGALLARLRRDREIRALGMDIDLTRVIRALQREIDVIQDDIDQGLTLIPDDAYDTVLLSETLQVVRKPRMVLNEMLRVAAQGVVVFPNFANWANRWRLGLRGRMPKSRALPFEWYETPNIHLATLLDFLELCRHDRITVREVLGLPQSSWGRLMDRLGLRNLRAGRVLVHVTRPDPMTRQSISPSGENLNHEVNE